MLTAMSATSGSDRLQILDEIVPFLVVQAQAEVTVIVLDDLVERRDAAVVVKTTLMDLFDIPEGTKRGRPVAPVRRAHGLEVINSDLVARVQVPAWFGEDRRDVAGRALGLVVEQRFPLLCGRTVKSVQWWHW